MLYVPSEIRTMARSYHLRTRCPTSHPLLWWRAVSKETAFTDKTFTTYNDIMNSSSLSIIIHVIDWCTVYTVHCMNISLWHELWCVYTVQCTHYWLFCIYYILPKELLIVTGQNITQDKYRSSSLQPWLTKFYHFTLARLKYCDIIKGCRLLLQHISRPLYC